MRPKEMTPPIAYISTINNVVSSGYLHVCRL